MEQQFLREEEEKLEVKELVIKQEAELQVHVESQAETFAPETGTEPEVEVIQY